MNRESAPTIPPNQSHDPEQFATFWNLPFDWVEKPNLRRGGWSGVSFHILNGQRLYVKRQENHNFKDWSRLGTQAPTFRREYRALRKLARAGIAVPDVTFYGESRSGKDHRAVLITQELEGYVTLTSLLTKWAAETATGEQPSPFQMPSNEAAAIDACAAIIRQFHKLGFQHNSMAGAHLFLKPVRQDQSTPSSETWQVCLLDVEKTCRSITQMRAAVREFTRFFRHTPQLRPDHRRRILDTYCHDWPIRKKKSLEHRIVQILQS